jgi:hypothetical protein
MKQVSSLFGFLFTILFSFAQTGKNSVPDRPKLVVGIVVDQMRWDYLYRYLDRFGEGGFKRLMREGFNCENTMLNYIPSYTGCGHATIFTGSVPAIHGIAANDWIDQLSGNSVYCTSDSTVQALEVAGAVDGKMSPRNLLVTTITDELRLATNFQSRVIGVSLKDRASILPAGHLATAAFWLDDASGKFITSDYYLKELPVWVKKFNDRKRIDALIEKGWTTIYPINTYKNSEADSNSYEGVYPGEQSPVFPHDLKSAYQKDKSSFRQMPFGNDLTLEFAKEALTAYSLGGGAFTDFLTINFASTDYVGHLFGINSIELEDVYIRLDRNLADLLSTLDAKLGRGKYLVFLTADHGAAHAIGFMKKHNLPADFWFEQPLADSLNKMLRSVFNVERLVRAVMNYQVNFDMGKISSLNLNYDAIRKVTVDYLNRQPGIEFAVDASRVGESSLPEPIRTMVMNGYHFKRSGGVQIILNPGWFEAYHLTGTTHGTWNAYDSHIPLLWYGWNIRQGSSNRPMNMTDIAPTLAALLKIQMPNGNVGKPIEELMK